MLWTLVWKMHLLTLWPWPLTFQPLNHVTSRISRGHFLHQVWTVWDYLFLSYAADKRTKNRQTIRRHRMPYPRRLYKLLRCVLLLFNYVGLVIYLLGWQCSTTARLQCGGVVYSGCCWVHSSSQCDTELQRQFVCRHVGVSAMAWHYSVTDSSVIMPKSSQCHRPCRQQCQSSRTCCSSSCTVFHRETTTAAVSDNFLHSEFDFSHLSDQYRSTKFTW